MQTTDLGELANLAPVAKSLLERGGFKVDMQSMDWQTQVTRRAKKVPVDQGGWNISMTAASVVLLIDPIVNHYTEASGDRAQFGWPLDEEIEKLRMAFAARERSQEAVRAGRAGAEARPRPRRHRAARPVRAADGAAQDRERQPRLAGHRVLERREEIGIPSEEVVGQLSKCERSCNETQPCKAARTSRRWVETG